MVTKITWRNRVALFVWTACINCITCWVFLKFNSILSVHSCIDSFSTFFVKSPLHIRFSIRPYSGSSLKRWSFSKIITTLIEFSQCLLDYVENKRSFSKLLTAWSWRKSPAKIIEKPPNGLVLSPISFNLLSSFINWGSFMNEISSMIRIRTSSHTFFCSSDNDSFLLLIKAVVQIVTPPNSEAADPVYAVKRKVLSLHKIPTA